MTHPLSTLLATLAFATAVALPAQTQIGVTPLSRLDTKASYGGIWGYTSPDYREFAVVGERTGTWVVETTDPRNPVEVAYVPGPSSTWREITSYRHMLYSVSEAHGGILLIDMSVPDLPRNLGYRFETLWSNSHTIAVDPDAGRIYVNGTTRGLAGMHILDVATDPAQPRLIGRYTNDYVHDVYARRGRAYLSLINRGRLRIVDALDPTAFVQIGEIQTPGGITHNAWATDDDTLLLTTDEDPSGYLTAYDITNPRLPVRRGDFRSPNGAIVHLVLGIGRTAFLAFYSDGYYALDFENPMQPRVIGSYDTSPQFVGTGFNGAWGVYPWSDDGTVYISDVQTGLHCLQQDVGHLHRYGLPSPGPSGTPRVTTEGASIRVGTSALRFQMTGLAPNAPFALVVSAQRASFPFLGVWFHVDPAGALLLTGAADAQGRASLPFPIPANDSLATRQLQMQLFALDASGLVASRGMWFGIAPR